ncbi:MAG: hypothetical protein EXR79_13545 [Myxococcales bacterium]|nr:hypothetical protein [Myxococcales bacterium]
MSLSDIAIRRPVLTIVVTLGILIMGGMSLRSLGTDLFPNVNFPVVTITTVYPGASPGEVESQLTRPIEDAVAGLEALDSVRSFSRESVSVVVVLFKLSADIEKAATGVRERLAAVRGALPAQIREPSIRRVDVGATPIRTYVAAGNLTNEQLRRATEDLIKPALERVAGVAAVEVVGGRDREVHVEVDRRKVAALNLPLTAITDKLRAENLALPAGHFDEGAHEVSVRLSGDLRSAAEVGAIAVATTPAGTQIRLAEVADVRDGFAETRTRIRSNGLEAVAFEVVKQSGMNTIQVADAVDKRLEEIKGTFPAGFSTRLIIDQAIFIRENAHEVEVSIVYGGLMAILVILFFMLDVRSTFISALALPTSVIGTFWAMDLLGFTINMMTLLALSLAIGLLIDDAVVVRENIFRHLQRGEDPITAASKGTNEIALAVFATTLTIVAVFLPVSFMSGVVGQFFKSFGLTVSAATLLSLFVAFTLDPMLSARMAVAIDHTEAKPWLVRTFERFHAAYEDAYAELLRWTVRHRLVTVLGAALAFVASLQLAKLMGNEFVTPEDRGQFMAEIELPPGTSLDETGRRTLAAEKTVLRDPHVTAVYAKLGPNSEVNKVMWRVLTVPKTRRPRTLSAIQNATRAAIQAAVPGAKVTISPPAFVEGLPAGAPLQVQVRGSDLSDLERDAAAVEAMLRTIPGLTDVQMYYSPGKPEQTVKVDRAKAADLGVPIAMVARTLRAALEGEDAGNLRLAQGARKEVRIKVRLRAEDRASIERLLDTPVATPKGFVPLRAIATVAPQSGPQVIERQDRTRQIVVAGVPAGRSLGEILKDLQPKLDAHKFQGDGYYRLDGQVKQMREMRESMGLAFALAVVFIFLILAAQFESFLHPFTIMLSLPMALIGAFVGLFLTDNAMSMGTNIGVILLMGLVTKNGILLVDAALQNQRDGMASLDAVIDAGRRRLRPILMTSAAMVLGMLPTAVIVGPGSEFRSPMAITVIGGVITSTLLTLLVVPSVFLWLDGGRQRVLGWFRRPVAGVGTHVGIPGASDVTAQVPPVAVTLGTLVVITIASAAWPGAAHAEAPVAGVPLEADATPQATLTLEAALAQGLHDSADLRVAALRLEEARAARAKVGSAWLPDIKAVGTFTHNSTETKFDQADMVEGIAKSLGFPLDKSKLGPPTVLQKENSVSAVLTVDQTVFALAPILLGRAVDRGIEAQELVLEATRRDIAFRIAEVFHNVAGLDRVTAVAMRAVDLADRRIATAKLRRAQGTEGDLPELRARAERSRAEQDLERARAGREQGLEVLHMLLGGARASHLVAPAALDLPAGNLESLVGAALRQRPDVRARAAAVAAAQASLREATLRWMPLLATSGHVRWSDTAGFSGENTTWAVNANLVVPLFDRGQRSADVEERRRTVARLEAEQEAAERQVTWHVRQAMLDIDRSHATAELARQQADVARRVKEIVDRTLAAGAATSLEVAEADTQLRMAEAGAEREVAGVQLAILRLRHLVGAP